jgi:nucleotide-binding universal stress UspA family protein
MSTTYRILFPIDLSSSSQGPAPVLRAAMESRRTEVTLLHVLEEEPKARTGAIALEAPMWQLEFIARRDFPGMRIIRRAERGRAADRILDYIRARNINLVVMPVRSPLGHVAEEVVSNAPCAVWLDWPRQAHASGKRRICCALEEREAED